MTKIAFIGVGNMGVPMANNLIERIPKSALVIDCSTISPASSMMKPK